MSLVDEIFGSIPTPLIDQWGVDIVYIKTSENQSYDPISGTTLGVSVEIPARALISFPRPKDELRAEFDGFYQQGDLRFIIPASYLLGYYPKITDSIRYVEAGASRIAKIIRIRSYRGDNPIMHAVYGRAS